MSLSADRRLAPLITSGQVLTCGAIELEVLCSARSHADVRDTRARRAALPLFPMGPRDFDRAADVMEALAARGRHRSVGIPDLLIAAAAERARATLLHYDSDFDAIASVTGQPAEWIVRRGSLP
jgi:predicted nucleic acid-binding protein